MLIDLRNKNISGKKVEEILGKADITINKNMVPFDDKSPFVTSGIRIGTAAISTRGLIEDDMLKIVNWMDELILNPEDSFLQEEIKKQVNEYMSSFPLSH